jgi:serine/threonine protein kinase
MSGAEREGVLVGIESTVLLVGADGNAPTIAANAGPAPPPASDAKRERYEMRGLLGEGGMGRVDCVWDNDLLREVAVKQLRQELRTNARTLEQFLWEARITAHLDHPNIVPVHDLGVAPDGQLYFSMKRVRGTSLEDVIEKLAEGEVGALERFPLARRLRAFHQLCHAIGFAHARGVLHRDIKPANVMLGDHGEVLVMDWGLASPLPGEAGEALRARVPSLPPKGVSGTPAYMSPEQVTEGELDARSDVYALGAVLYELVELRRAIEAPSVPAILVKVSQGEVRATERANASLAAVIQRAMAKERDARYASVAELALDIETVLDGRTPRAESANVLKQASRWYLSRDPAFSRFRVIDIDFLVGGASFMSAAAGVYFAHALRPYVWLLVVAGVLVGIGPTVRFFRARRAAAQRLPE